jgi:cell wall-associated NlpC family hydrolase
MAKLTDKMVLLAGLTVCLTGCLASNPLYNRSQRDDDDGRLLRDEAVYADKLAHQLSQAIDAYLGVPYKWGGTTAMGMDCSGFVSVVYQKAVGLVLPRNSVEMFKLGREVDFGDLYYGDLVFFENIEDQGVSHVGIYVGNSEFAHAGVTEGVTISAMLEPYYIDRYVGARRLYGAR